MFVLRILALVLTAISLVPSAAHLFELPGKIGLDEEAYFTVQSIYAGWAFFAVPIFAAIILNAVLALLSAGAMRRPAGRSPPAFSSPQPRHFVHFVFPGNSETQNWTTRIAGWRTLRTNWQYGHAAGAVIVFLAFLATCMATVRRR